MPNARAIAGVDAHSIRYFDRDTGVANALESPVTTEADVIEWMQGMR